MTDASTFATDIDKIRTLKARYFRFMDTKDWAAFRDLFTEDLEFYRDADPVPTSTEPVTTSAAAFVDRIQTWLESAVTVHHGHMEEIQIESETKAQGIWAMFDWVDNPQYGRAYQGFGHYHERYEKGTDGIWRIARLRLTRLRIVHLEPTDPAEISRAKQAWLDRRL